MAALKQIAGVSLLAVALAQSGPAAAAPPVSGPAVEARVTELLNSMSLSEKINFIRVDDGHMIPVLPRLNLPGTTAYDSYMGVHVNGATFGAQYPSSPALSATWNINRAKEVGLALAYETRAAGGQQLLGPTINLYRTPFNGRAAEYIGGEDPFIGAVLAAAATNGVQAQGIQAGAKHFLANEQEANRHLIDIHVDQRTLRELYLPPFESVAKNANIASIMCGFHKLNGEYVCENHHIITDILKGEWGYQGFVMSDFNAITDAFRAAFAGVDLDMPTGLQFTEAKLLPLIQSGQLTMNVIDDKVRRNLRAMVSYGFDTGLPPATGLTDPLHGIRAALNTAREAIVLLKNDRTNSGAPLLPLARTARIAVIGNWAQDAPSSPFGTANSPPNTYVSELSGLRQLAVNGANIDFIDAMSLNPRSAAWQQGGSQVAGTVNNSGLKAEYFANTTLAGNPVVTRVEPGVNWDFLAGRNITNAGETAVSGFTPQIGAFSARFTGFIQPTFTGEHVFKVRASGAYQLWVDDRLIIDEVGTPKSNDIVDALTNSGKTASLLAGTRHTVRLEFRWLPANFTPALGGFWGVQMSWAALTPPAALAAYDAVVVSGGFNYEYEGEGFDRRNEMPEFQSEMISNVARRNANTLVVMHGGGGFNMLPWADQVRAIMHAWYPGQQGGQALAEIVFGRVNPSGKLPISIERRIEDNPSYPSYSDPAAYQGPDALTDMTYSEGLYMGYRGFDKSGIAPLYPFGYGLSYTSFAYSNLFLSANVLVPGAGITATFTITNTGDKAGFETAQLYVQPLDATVDRPLKELKGFAKVFLQVGESKQVTIPLDARSFAYYVENTDSWNVDTGRYQIKVGGSSVSLPLNSVVSALYGEVLTTRDSNPLPPPMRDAVQVNASQAY